MNKIIILLTLIVTISLTVSINCQDTNHVTYYKKSLNAFHERIIKNIPAGYSYFYGDSQIQGLSNQAIDIKSINFGIGHFDSYDLLEKINKQKSFLDSSYIIIGIGINDIIKGNFDLESRIDETIKSIYAKGGKYIALISIQPIGSTKKNHSVINRKILEANELLKDSCKKNNALYIDINSHFSTNNDQTLKIEYDIGDGLHFSAAGYDKMIELISLATSKFRK